MRKVGALGHYEKNITSIARAVVAWWLNVKDGAVTNRTRLDVVSLPGRPSFSPVDIPLRYSGSDRHHGRVGQREREAVLRMADSHPRTGRAGAAGRGTRRPGRRATSLYWFHIEPGGRTVEAPRERGSLEHVVLDEGSVLVGPLDRPVLLRAGEAVSYPADVPHIFQAYGRGARGHLVVTQLRALAVVVDTAV
jgi:hypothetical protein